MAKSLWVSSGTNTAVSANVTTYFILTGGNTTGTETNKQYAVRPAGTFSNLVVRVTVNSVTATSTYRLRKNGANVNLTASVAASTTGLFEDTINTDTVANGDLCNYQLIAGATGTSITCSLLSIVFQPSDSTKTVTKYNKTDPTDITAASTTANHGFNDTTSGFTSTEANVQTKMKKAGALKYLQVYVDSNARTTTTTLRTRKNGANGAQSVSITSTATGRFEDTTNSDTIAVNDLVNVQYTSGTGTQTLSVITLSVSYESTNNNDCMFTTGQSVATSLAASTTSYGSINGMGTITGIDDRYRTLIHINGTLSNYGLTISSNATTATSTGTVSVASASAAVTVSVAAAGTGLFEDTTNTQSVTSGDEISFKVIVGAGGTLSFRRAYVHFTVSAGAQLYDRPISETSISVSESLTKYTVRPKTISETAVSVSETLARIQTLIKTISESSITTSETLARIQYIFKTISEEPSVSVSETLARIQTLIKTISESAITTSDTVVRIPLYLKPISESAITTSDSIVRLFLPQRAISESAITTSDTIARWISISYTLTEPSISVSDVIAGALFYQRTISDPSITVTDTLARIQFLIKSITEPTISVSDSIARIAVYLRLTSDPSISIDEALVRIPTYVKTISETAITTNDSIVRLLLATRTISDPSVSISDTIARIQTILKQISDPSISVSDSLTAGILFVAAIVESRVKWYYSLLTRKIPG